MFLGPLSPYICSGQNPRQRRPSDVHVQMSLPMTLFVSEQEFLPDGKENLLGEPKTHDHLYFYNSALPHLSSTHPWPLYPIYIRGHAALPLFSTHSSMLSQFLLPCSILWAAFSPPQGISENVEARTLSDHQEMSPRLHWGGRIMLTCPPPIDLHHPKHT